MWQHFAGIGNLTKDVEVKHTQATGTPVATLSLAFNRKVKQGDEWKDKALFMDAVVFGKMAEVCGQYLAKGKKVLVSGCLDQQRWEKDGQKHSKINILADEVKFLSPRDEGQSDASGDNVPDEHSAVEPF